MRAAPAPMECAFAGTAFDVEDLFGFDAPQTVFGLRIVGTQVGSGAGSLDLGVAAANQAALVGAGSVTQGAETTATVTNVENVIGTTSNDVIVGNDVANRLDGGEGDDLLTGGGGADVFVFGAAASGNDVITDFEDGADLITFEGDLTFADLTITDDEGDALITFDGGSIRLEGVSAAALTAADFDFEIGADSVLDTTPDLLI